MKYIVLQHWYCPSRTKLWAISLTLFPWWYCGPWYITYCHLAFTFKFLLTEVNGEVSTHPEVTLLPCSLILQLLKKLELSIWTTLQRIVVLKHCNTTWYHKRQTDTYWWYCSRCHWTVQDRVWRPAHLLSCEANRFQYHPQKGHNTDLQKDRFKQAISVGWAVSVVFSLFRIGRRNPNPVQIYLQLMPVGSLTNWVQK